MHRDAVPLCEQRRPFADEVSVVRILNCGPYTVNLFTAGSSKAIVYIVMGQEDAQTVWAMLEEPRPALAAISGVDWNRELSPWGAPRVFRGGEGFAGSGSAFLSVLTGQILPLAKAQLDFVPASRAIAGYSLAGLFSLWAAFQTDVFDRTASISGSLWFDGFLNYMKSAAPPKDLRQAYLSLGSREKGARNQRMAVVEDCTRQAVELLRGWDVPVDFEMNEGGHFQDVPDRIARGIGKLMQAVQ